MKITIISAVLRLYLLHLTAALAIWPAMYYPGWDKFLSVLYLFLLVVEIYTYKFKFKAALVIAFLWQLPGLLLALSSIVSLDWWGLGDLSLFILSFWYTPWLPWLSIAKVIINDYPLSYYLLLVWPLINFLLVILIALMSSSLKECVTKKPVKN